MDKAHQDDILQFIRRLSRAIRENRIYLVYRKKNRDTMAKLELTIQNVLNELKGLQLQHYLGGPEPDRDCEGTIWKFEKKIKGLIVHIKVNERENGNWACISFHE